MVEQGNRSRFSGFGSRGLSGAAKGRGAMVSGGPSSGSNVTTAAPGSILKAIWQSRWIVLGCIVVALAAGFLYIEKVATPIYTSFSKLYLDSGNISIVSSYEAGRVPATDKYLQTQAELLKSTRILGAILEDPEVRRMRTFDDMDVPLALLRTEMRVYVGRGDEIITVLFGSPYAIEAAQIVNRVVESYMAYRADHDQTNFAQILQGLQEEKVTAGKELEKKRADLADFVLNGTPLSLGSEAGGGVLEAYLDYQSACSRAESLTMEAESFLEGVDTLAEHPAALMLFLQSRGGTGGYMALGAERSPLEAKLIERQFQLRDLLADFTASSPRVTAVEFEIKQIKDTLAEVDARFVEAARAAAEQQYERAKEHEEKLTQRYEEQRRKVKLVSAELAKHRDLSSAVTRLEAYWDERDKQIRELESVAGEDVGQLRMGIMEPAVTAEEPSEPHKGKVMAMALFLGLFSGAGFAVLRDLLNQTLRSSDEVSTVLGLPVLGVIPAMSRHQKIQTRGQKVLLEPDSPEAEAFRTVRTAVLFGAPNAKTLLITSPSAGDGKSTLVSNLAIAMARAGQKTVLLDADFRRPMQHVIFGMNHEEAGLSAVLAGKIKLSQAVQPTQVKDLSLISCGGHVLNPAEILNGERFAAVLKRLVEVYDRVLVDAPPATVVTDAQILGALCDITVLVVRAEKSTRKASQRAAHALQSVGAQLLGTVVNDVRKGGDRYGYYGGYGRARDSREEGQIRPAQAHGNGKRLAAGSSSGSRGA